MISTFYSKRGLVRLLLLLSFALATATTAFVAMPIQAQISPEPSMNSAPKTYKQWLKEAAAELKQGKLVDALSAAQAAGKLDPKGYEAPAMAALILAQANQPSEAKAALASAMALVPQEKRESLEAISQQIAQITTSKSSPSPSVSLSSADQRQLEVLRIPEIKRSTDSVCLSTTTVSSDGFCESRMPSNRVTSLKDLAIGFEPFLVLVIIFSFDRVSDKTNLSTFCSQLAFPLGQALSVTAASVPIQHNSYLGRRGIPLSPAPL